MRKRSVVLSTRGCCPWLVVQPRLLSRVSAPGCSAWGRRLVLLLPAQSAIGGRSPASHQPDTTSSPGARGGTCKLWVVPLRHHVLLCELHAHTAFSDGDLSLRETVDVYGLAGFDVLCITDHCVRADDPWLETASRPNHVQAANFDRYLQAVEREADRARARFDMLVVPGLELTYWHHDPRFAAHAVAVGLRSFVGVEEGVEKALVDARAAGAALIAAHPYRLEDAQRNERGTARFAVEWPSLHRLVDRFELANRHELFPWVARAKLPYVASGDFHRPEHLNTWKTLVPCAKSEAALVSYLRSPTPVHITRLAAEGPLGQMAA